MKNGERSRSLRSLSSGAGRGGYSCGCGREGIEWRRWRLMTAMNWDWVMQVGLTWFKRRLAEPWNSSEKGQER